MLKILLKTATLRVQYLRYFVDVDCFHDLLGFAFVELHLFGE